jgi:hypothetical protein
MGGLAAGRSCGQRFFFWWMMPEQYSDLPFPINGLELSHSFAAQPQLTTRVGINVRAYEAGQNRARGGLRQGLSKFVPGQIPTMSKIQHLNYVVDPSATALLANFGNGGGGDPGVLDPSTNPSGSVFGDPNFRNNGNMWRTGGSGIQPNRNLTLTINNPISGTVTASPPSVPGDGATPSLITVNVMDRYNFPVEGDTIAISTSPSGRVGDGLTGTTDGFGNFEFDVTDNQQEVVVYTAQDTTKGVTIGSASVNYGTIMFIQDNGTHEFFTLSGPVSHSGAFPGDVTSGDLILVFVLGFASPADNTQPPVNDITFALSDTQGNGYLHVGSYARISNTYPQGGSGSAAIALSLWTTLATATGPLTVTATMTSAGNPGGTGIVGMIWTEWSGVAQAAADGTSLNSGSGGSWTTGSISVPNPGSLVVGFFESFPGNMPTVGAGFTSLAATVTTDIVEYQLNVNSSIPATATAASTSYVGIGASWKP